MKQKENVKEEVAAKLKLLTEYVFRKENLVISYVCKDDEYDSLPGLVEDMTDSLYDKDEYIDFFKNLDIASNFELVGIDYNMYGRKVEIYRLN